MLQLYCFGSFSWLSHSFWLKLTAVKEKRATHIHCTLPSQQQTAADTDRELLGERVEH